MTKLTSIDLERMPKIELHLHLDGAIRFDTLWEASQRKKISIDGAKTFDEMKDKLVIRKPCSLSELLTPFKYFLPVIIGDTDLIERVAYETAIDQHKNGVIYFEARFAPHFLVDSNVTVRDVVEAVRRGFSRAEEETDIIVRTILCCIRKEEQWNDEILALLSDEPWAQEQGCVAIDVAGSADGADEQYEPSVQHVFQLAAERGIHRTVHAGESAGAKSVELAVDKMAAERIGHGYHVLGDQTLYDRLRRSTTHFECCPLSSYLTGSVPPPWSEHVVRRFARDGVNFSISRDDPTVMDNTMCSELHLAHDQIGLTIDEIWQCQLNAAKSCFADPDIKAKLIARIMAAKPGGTEVNGH